MKSIAVLVALLAGCSMAQPRPTYSDGPKLRQWKVERRSVDEYRDDLGFSHIECDLCGSAPGDRHAVTAMPTNPAENHDYVALSVCNSCIMYIANGDEPDDEG